MVVDMVIIVVFRVKEMEGTLAGVMEGTEGSVVGGTRAGAMGRVWCWLVGGGKGFDRFMEAVLE